MRKYEGVEIIILTIFVITTAGCGAMSTSEMDITDGKAVNTMAYAAAEPAEMAREGQPPVDMFFEDYGTNPFIDTEDDNLSTFAIDVDTGSYTIMRRYVQDALLPPGESVRVEEYVNYFDYGYDAPEDKAFALHIEGAPAPYGENDRYHLVRVGLQGYEVPEELRPDATLIFVIDVSGSMDMENRLGLVKESLHLLLDSLRPTDRVGIVIYGSTAEVKLKPTYVDAKSTIERAIDDLQPEGSTNAAEGIMMAYQLVEDFVEEGHISRLILCSDGVANVGQNTAEAILGYAQEGISLSTFGFGLGNYNDVLMEQLADQGDGSYAYVDTIREAERLFVTNLNGTLMTIAEEAKIQVEFNPEVVERYRLLGYENRDIADEDFRDDKVDAGEVGAGHSVTALYEVKFREDAPANEAAMTARVRYTDPDSGEAMEIERTASLADFHETFEEGSLPYQLAAVVAEYAEILGESFWVGENGLNALVPDARRIAEYLPGDEDVQEFVDLVIQAAEMADSEA
ncbi:MAG: von Willebrand factor type A domain-containing protein [Candidatus Promineifilaceae bacterium]